MDGIVAAAASDMIPAVLVMAVAALVLAWSWQGRRVDAHPTCRRCGFGLNGRSHLMTPACPDCGADLSRPRAVRVGRRRKRPALIALSLSVVLGATAWVALSSRARARGVQVVHYTPSSWLLDDSGRGGTPARNAALVELARRVGRGELSRAREQALVEQALAYQADWRRPWVPGWGDVVEAARAAGRLSDEQWALYQVQSISLALEPQKATIRPTDDLVLHLFRGPDRTSSRRTSFNLMIEPEPAVSVAGRSVPCVHDVADGVVPVPDREAGERPAAGRKIASAGPIDLEQHASLKALAGGPQAVTASVRIRPVRLKSAADPSGPDDYVPLPGERRVEVAGRFTLRDEPPPLDELVGPEWKGVSIPESHREAVLRADAKRKEAMKQSGRR